MAKIPVGATIARAYRFAFGDFLKILGVIWFAAALSWIPGLLWRHKLMALMSARDPSAMAQTLPIMLPTQIVAFVVLSMMLIGVARLALGLHRGPAWFYFSLGKPVWRLVGSYLLIFAAAVLGYLAFLLSVLLLGAVVALLAKAIQGAIAGIVAGILAIAGILAVLGGFIYCAVRLSFLLPPVVAAEEPGFALGRAWGLGKGNFWRMLVVIIAVLGPFAVLELAFLIYWMHGLPAFNPAQPAAFQAAMDARMAATMQMSFRYWYVTYPLGLAVLAIFYGANAGAQCFAWQALTQTAESDPVPGH
ncbi:MAG: hypothetical protein H6924_10395 [Alphaproteobacteria bacterium]|nr:hypothetical protein [Alphaproteobacteria bacterium]